MAQKRRKHSYRLRNRGEYNRALVRRGSLTLWVSDDALAAWRAHEQTGRRGSPRTYADAAILCMATLAEVYHLPLRATRGLLASLIRLPGVGLPVPCHTTLCRRLVNRCS